MTGPVLVVRFSAIGDCVMAAWAVSDLKRAGVGPVTWAVQERCSAVIASPGLVNEVVLGDRDAWKKRRWSPATWRAQLVTFGKLRRYGFAYGLDLQGHSKTAICVRVSGAKRRFSSRATDALAGRINQLVDCGAGEVHEIEVSKRLVRSVFGIKTTEERPFMPEVERVEAWDFSIQTGAGHRDKVVPTAHWNDVARDLVGKGHRVVAVGGPGDPELAVDGVENLVGRLSLRESMGVLASSRVHLAGDTGSGHLAGAYGVPVVSVFGPMSSALYRPMGSPSVVLERGGDPAAILPDEIVEAGIGLLEGR